MMITAEPMTVDSRRGRQTSRRYYLVTKQSAVVCVRCIQSASAAAS